MKLGSILLWKENYGNDTVKFRIKTGSLKSSQINAWAGDIFSDLNLKIYSRILYGIFKNLNKI